MTKDCVSPGGVVGVLGGGQLGRMLALAAARLGLATHVYCAQAHSPAFSVSARHWVGEFDDRERLAEFARSVDVITWEFENVPVSAVDVVAPLCPVYPPRRALEIAQDRLAEKRFLSSLAIPVAPYARVDRPEDLAEAMASLGTPGLLKTRRLGYDGKGQQRLEAGADPTEAVKAIGEAPAIYEAWVPFETELSALVVRGRGGESAVYDISENTHDSQILKEARVPARVPEAAMRRAREIAQEIAVAMDYVGVLAVEFFYLGAAAPEPLLVNEIAPRVHNSGHWSLDACVVDQFENHIRAIAGWPLGDTWRHSDAVMTNLLGKEVEAWRDLAHDKALALHLYGKREARPGRKMGHVTRLFPKGSQKRGEGR